MNDHQKDAAPTADDALLFVPQSRNRTAGARMQRIRQLIRQIESGESVELKELRGALGPALWQSLSDELGTTPPSKEALMRLRPYQAALQRADALNRRKQRPVPSPLQRFKQGPIRPPSAEDAYCRALEVLAEILDDFPVARRWLDRPARFGEVDEPGAAIDEVPRLKGSRSSYARTRANQEAWAAAALQALRRAAESMQDEKNASSWLLPVAAGSYGVVADGNDVERRHGQGLGQNSNLL
jgi:hypothetical protein